MNENEFYLDVLSKVHQLYEQRKWEEYNFPLIKTKKKLINDFSNICVVGSSYGLLLYLLYVGDIKRTIFVFQGHYPLKSIADEMRKLGCVCFFISYNENYENERIAWSEMVKQIASCDFRFYIQDTMPAFEWFKDKPVYLIEDGRISYISRLESLKTNGFNIYIYQPNVKEIIYSGLEPVPDGINCKTTIISIYDYWNRKTDNEKKQILAIMGFDFENVMGLVLSGRDTVVFTRNYSTIGKCSLQNHINMYKELISHYDSKKVIIKPHPNDNVNYETIFPQCCVLSRAIPAELMLLCGVPIVYVASVDASSNVFGSLNKCFHVDLYEYLLEKYDVISLRKKAKMTSVD